MMQCRYILLILLMGVSFLSTASLWKGEAAVTSGSKGRAREEMNTKPQITLEVAQKDEAAKAADKEPTQTPNKDHTGSEDDKAKTPKDRKHTSFKDFVPSEKIAGDSAVDFPADI